MYNTIASYPGHTSFVQSSTPLSFPEDNYVRFKPTWIQLDPAPAICNIYHLYFPLLEDHLYKRTLDGSVIAVSSKTKEFEYIY